jgi:hypothetical protein
MEYWNNDNQLLDFVFASGETNDPDFHARFSDFFEEYRRAGGREGVYLTSADTAEPMWDAVFSNPAEMRSKDAQIRLIEARAEENARSENLIESLMKQLWKVSSTDDLKRLSSDVNIPWRKWFRDGSISEEVANLVDAALTSDKMLPLSQATYLEFV